MGVRARECLPGARITTIGGTPELPFPDGEFALILLLAVLTCIPDDTAQTVVITELVRLTSADGTVLISDLIQRPDPRSTARYAEGRPGP